MRDKPMTLDHATGTIRAIAARPVDGAAMAELTECQVEAGRGITTENRKSGKREVTLLSREAWAVTCRELGADVPWLTRRANFLIEGLDLPACIGQEITLGSVRIRIHGETRPCQLMDDQHQGLRAVMVPQCRGGVHGQVLIDGIVRIGDPVRVVLAPAT